MASLVLMSPTEPTPTGRSREPGDLQEREWRVREVLGTSMTIGLKWPQRPQLHGQLIQGQRIQQRLQPLGQRHRALESSPLPERPSSSSTLALIQLQLRVSISSAAAAGSWSCSVFDEQRRPPL
ncbi:unnamed protein product [Pleuronectes platessa]|uniref:Uncharacterized protein n=1 Tax=Pleuronectes platessa TaxID=8262 RepID=A0A9N7TI74_PLEPL|nr:unnamed protein product [Pleuronectes platessa]